MNIQTEKNQLPKKRMSNRTLGAAAAAVAFALIATPFLGSTAEATLDTGKFCIQAVNAEDTTITGKSGACRSDIPVGPEIPGEVPSEFELSYSANISAGRSAAVFMVDNLTGEERQISDHESGAMSGSTWVFDAPAESTGWKMQARNDGTVIAEASIAPSDLKEHDAGGGWIYKRASVALANKPIEAVMSFYIYAERDNSDPRNVVSEPYSYTVVDDSTGQTVASGDGMTGLYEDHIRFSKTYTMPGHEIGTYFNDSRGGWQPYAGTLTATFEYRGGSYSVTKDAITHATPTGPLSWTAMGAHGGFVLQQRYPGVSAG